MSGYTSAAVVIDWVPMAQAAAAACVLAAVAVAGFAVRRWAR